MMTNSPMVIGLPPEQLRAFVEARLGPLADLGVAVLVPDHSQSQLKQTQAWLGQWALEHPDTTYPWRREQARRQVATVARQLEQSRLVLARAQAQFREELAGRERALVADLDQALLAAGQLNLALVALHQAAHATFGSGHGSGVWSKAFAPLTPSWRGEVPGAVQLWRRVLRKHGILSAAGGDQDWETLCAPVRPPPVVLPAFQPPVAPPGSRV